MTWPRTLAVTSKHVDFVLMEDRTADVRLVFAEFDEKATSNEILGSGPIRKWQLLSGHAEGKDLAIYRDLARADVSAEYEEAMRSFPVR